MYCVFSLTLSAWWGNNSVYTSSLADARQFTYDDAIKFCKKHYDNQSGLGAVPVSLEAIDAVRNK